MNPQQVAHCAMVAERLIAARVQNDRAAWADELAHAVPDYQQLAIYLICATLDDIPEPPRGPGDMRWWTVVSAGVGDDYPAWAAKELANGADLLNNCWMDGEWNDAWHAADDQARWALVHMVELTWKTAIGDDRAAMRALHVSISSLRKPSLRRRLRRARDYYRWLPRLIWTQHRIDQACGNRPSAWSYLRYIRRNTACDYPSIPAFRDGKAISGRIT